ncbi:MAG: hypothetical protein HQL56_03280 [Magnetococcales bacterium]|nr:hypothetical protein [Magnetococcales bacterium]
MRRQRPSRFEFRGERSRRRPVVHWPRVAVLLVVLVGLVSLTTSRCNREPQVSSPEPGKRYERLYPAGL